MKSMFQKNGIEFRVLCEISHPMVVADEDKLKEVLINLIGNSLKFTSKGSVTVTQRIEKNMLITEVADTGIGIDPEKHHLLFSRFQQAMSRTIAREAGGSVGS